MCISKWLQWSTPEVFTSENCVPCFLAGSHVRSVFATVTSLWPTETTQGEKGLLHLTVSEQWEAGVGAEAAQQVHLVQSSLSVFGCQV